MFKSRIPHRRPHFSRRPTFPGAERNGPSEYPLGRVRLLRPVGGLLHPIFLRLGAGPCDLMRWLHAAAFQTRRAIELTIARWQTQYRCCLRLKCPFCHLDRRRATTHMPRLSRRARNGGNPSSRCCRGHVCLIRPSSVRRMPAQGAEASDLRSCRPHQPLARSPLRLPSGRS